MNKCNEKMLIVNFAFMVAVFCFVRISIDCSDYCLANPAGISRPVTAVSREDVRVS